MLLNDENGRSKRKPFNCVLFQGKIIADNDRFQTKMGRKMILSRTLINIKKMLKGRYRRNILILGLIVCDVVSIFIAYSLAVIIRFGNIQSQLEEALLYLPWLSLLFCGLFFALKLYHSLWKYSGVSEAIRIILCMALGMGICFSCNYLFGLGISHIVLFFFGFILILMIGASRFGYRMVRHIAIRKNGVKEKSKRPRALLVVGAGFSGALIITRLQNEKKNYKSIVLVDDDENKQNMLIRGVRVAGKVTDIPRIATQKEVTDIFIAIPSLSRTRLAEIYDICKSTGCRVRMLPLLQDVDIKKEDIEKVREVRISDILFRKEVDLDIQCIGGYLNGKDVLVTGGGGSIGSAICRQLARFHVRSLTILDIYENTAYELLCELKEKYGEALDAGVVIASVRDKERLKEVFKIYKPQIVFHAAAHKHVPLMEQSPMEAIKNNIGGTLNVLETASRAGVERFVQLSTDKAVNPTNVMGATKRVTELVVQSFARKTDMKCMSVRFGNVIGSHGSVLPLMERQIKCGGPVTVTHEDITRYFMTITEAAQLVLQAGGLADSGAIYVLDMGEPVRIMDLARKIIRFYGYEPEVDIPIKIIGLRPGEKMFEELTMSEENKTLSRTAYGSIFRVQPVDFDMDRLDAQIGHMLDAAQKNDVASLCILQSAVPNYHTEKEALSSV